MEDPGVDGGIRTGEVHTAFRWVKPEGKRPLGRSRRRWQDKNRRGAYRIWVGKT